MAASRGATAVRVALLALATLFALFPIAWGVSTSLKAVSEVNALPPIWIPASPTADNYADALSRPRFWLFVRNTVIVIACSLVLSLLLSTHAAWAVVRCRFRGKNMMLFSIWATTMIPGVSILVPLYLVAVETGLYDTYFVLVLVYSAWAVPTLVWLMRGFVAAIPVELEEAARVDGCSTFGAFYRVTLPLLPPGMLAGGIMVFLMIWNEFLIGYSLVISDDHRIIQVGLYSFTTEAGIEWGPLMASVTCSLLPVALFYAVLQRYFVQGLTGGSLKG
jgi:ABC-type glycerol-3-phosphate transport system permease component